MKKNILFLLFVFLVFPALSQNNNSKPKLVVGIVIDQLRYDIIAKYWDKFSDDGFKKVINQGAFCKNAQYNYVNINSASGCATIACGSYPAQHGIVNLQWYNRLTNNKVFCVDDNLFTQVGTNFGSGKSPKNLSSLTWTDQLRISTFKMSKVFSVGIKDYSSIISGGKLANAAFWFDENTGNWVSSSFYMDSLSDWVNNFNSKKFPDIYMNRTWETSFPIQNYIESLSDGTSYEKGFDNQSVFPYNLNTLKAKYNNYSLLKYTPFANTLTKDFAINLIMNEFLGGDAYTDALLINFSATSFIGDLFGLQSVEIEDAYIKLDKDISHLIAAIEDYVGKNDVIFYITSDRGSCDNQDWLHDINITTGEFNSTRATVLISSYLRAVYGMNNWIEGFFNNELYLDQFEIDKASLSVEEFQQKSAQLLVNIDGINTVISSSELQKGTFSAGIMQQAQNSYFQSRSGDLFVILDYGWRFKTANPSLCNCNSAYNENTHVPVIFYGKNIEQKEIYRQISMDDLATTMCFLLNIPLPNKSTGQPISEIIQ